MCVLTKEEIIKEEFLTAAQKLFQQYGFQKTTMEDIAKAIGKGKSTLYYYYKSKSEVFQDVIIREADEVINSVFEATQKASSAVEKLQIYLQFSFDTLKSKGYQIIATTPHENDCLMEDFDISKPSALFFGTERDGLSEEILKRADGFLKIPMVGFTESLNISVSAAIIIQNLTNRLRNSTIDWHLSENEILE